MIDKINHYSFTTPASVHDEEAMTALELSGRLGAKMNETVEEVNNAVETIDVLVQSIPLEVKDEVQRNIEAGEFNQAINAYAGGLKEKVDNLVENVPSGATTMDAEIIDARRDEKTSTVYASLGKSISAQIDRHTLDNSLPFVKNLYDSSKVLEKFYVSGDGNVYTHNDFVTSEMIRVQGGKVIHFSTLAFYEAEDSEVFRRARGGVIIPYLATYDENQTFLTLYQDVEEKQYLPETVSFIRFSVEKPDRNSIMCSYFNPYLMYMTGNEKLIRPECVSDYNEVNDTLLNANMINPAEVEEGYYVASTNGTLYPNANNFATGYMPIKYLKEYALFNRDMSKVTIRMYCIFDRDGILVTGGENVNTITLTEYGNEPYFVRLTIDNSLLGKCMFTHSDATVFAEYGSPVIRESAIPNSTATIDLSQLESHLGGTFKRAQSNTLSFPAYLHNFDIMVHGSGSKFIVNVGDTAITTATDNDEYNTFIHISCREGTATVTKANTNGVSTTTVTNVDSGDISCSGATLISATSTDFSRPVWVIGDSYMGANSDRVYGQLKALGCGEFMRLSRSGLDSAGGYAELVKALEYGTPTTLVWYVGLNDTNENAYKTYLSMVEDLCEERGITLILNRVPTLVNTGVTLNHNTVNASGHRYIDSFNAVCVSPTSWRAGTLSTDNVHPTELGAKLLAMRMMVDVPEIMSYRGDE